jgi:hypothetical protein
MSYFTTKDELKHMNFLLQNFERIIAIENKVRDKIVKKGATFIGPYDMFIAIRNEASRTVSDYQELRATFARMIHRANEICEREEISWHRQGYSAHIEGGMPFQGSVFELVLNRPSDIMDLDVTTQPFREIKAGM